jgi:Fic family protein
MHPFDDGNGRIARAIADQSLARSEESWQRFYSMSAQVREERGEHYDIFERTQKETFCHHGVEWCLGCLRARSRVLRLRAQASSRRRGTGRGYATQSLERTSAAGDHQDARRLRGEADDVEVGALTQSSIAPPPLGWEVLLSLVSR